LGQFNPTLVNGVLTVGNGGSVNYSETGSALCVPPPGGQPIGLVLANGGDLHDLRFCNLGVGMASAGNYSLTNAQFINCAVGLKSESAGFYAGNILMSKVGTGFFGQNFQGQVEQLTYDQGTQVTDDPNGANTQSSMVWRMPF